MNYKILTNNPLVLSVFPDAEKIEGTVLDVIIETRNKISQGYKLISHPLSGNIALDRTPYKTVVISGKCGEIDLLSLRTINNALNVAAKLFENKPLLSLQDSMIRDLQFLDYELIKNI